MVENVTNLQQQKQPTPTVMENVTALQQQQQPTVQSTPMVVGNVLQQQQQPTVQLSPSFEHHPSESVGSVQRNSSTEEFIALEANLIANEVVTLDMEEGSTKTVTDPLSDNLVNRNPPFTLQYIAVRNEHRVEPVNILSPVIDTSDVSKFVVPPDGSVDPTLQKEVEFMNAWMAKAAETDVPFIPVVSKSQKKKGNNNTKVAYQTCSSSSVPPSQ